VRGTGYLQLGRPACPLQSLSLQADFALMHGNLTAAVITNGYPDRPDKLIFKSDKFIFPEKGPAKEQNSGNFQYKLKSCK
jgi:hypothetical protein